MQDTCHSMIILISQNALHNISQPNQISSVTLNIAIYLDAGEDFTWNAGYMPQHQMIILITIMHCTTSLSLFRFPLTMNLAIYLMLETKGLLEMQDTFYSIRWWYQHPIMHCTTSLSLFRFPVTLNLAIYLMLETKGLLEMQDTYYSIRWWYQHF